MFERTLRVKNMHKIEIYYVIKTILNQKFTDKIGLRENANIHKNIHYEDIKIKGGIQIGTHPSFH